MKYSDLCTFDKHLHDYQQEAKEEVFAKWDSMDRIMVQMPTGTGKTHLFMSVAKDFLYNDSQCRVLVIVNGVEMLTQTANQFKKQGKKSTFIWRNNPVNMKCQVFIASIATLASRIEEWKNTKFDLIVIDEAHHSLSSRYQKVLDAFPDTKVIGVTATPCRTSGAGFTDIYDSIIISQQISDFIEKGYLAKYTYCSIPRYSSVVRALKGIATTADDYVNNELDAAFNTHKVRAQIVETYKKFADGKKGVVFAINKKHAKAISEDFQAAGIIASYLDSDTPQIERKRIVQDFIDGKITVLCNVNILSEGFDLPNLEFVQLARPTKSLTLHLQQIGRGLRKNGDKICTILDNVGAYFEFGLPSRKYDWERYFEGDKNIQEAFEAKNSKGKSKERVTDLAEGDEEVQYIEFADDKEYVYSQVDKVLKIYEELDCFLLKKELSLRKTEFLQGNILKKGGCRYNVYMAQSTGDLYPLRGIVEAVFNCYVGNDLRFNDDISVKKCYLYFKELVRVDGVWTLVDSVAKERKDVAKYLNQYLTDKIYLSSEWKINATNKKLAKIDTDIIDLAKRMYICAEYKYNILASGVYGFAACSGFYQYFPQSLYQYVEPYEGDTDQIDDLVNHFWGEEIRRYKALAEEMRRLYYHRWVDLEGEEFDEEKYKSIYANSRECELQEEIKNYKNEIKRYPKGIKAYLIEKGYLDKDGHALKDTPKFKVYDENLEK